jgi:uncharacterized protein HemX
MWIASARTPETTSTSTNSRGVGSASDLVRDVLNRLGAAGLALIVGALVFGAILGATAAHRADQIATQSAAAHQEQGNQDNQDQQGNAQTEQGQTDKQDSKSTKPTKKTPKAPTKKKTTPTPDHD